MTSTNTVLPPYQSNFDPISSKPTGLYNPSSFGAAYTNPPGTNIYCGGKGKRRSIRRKLKTRRKSKGRSKKTRGRSKKTRGTKRKR